MARDPELNPGKHTKFSTTVEAKNPCKNQVLNLVENWRQPQATIASYYTVVLCILVLYSTVPLYESKLFISRTCLILVLATVLGRPRRADVKKDAKNYQGPKKAFLSRS